LGYVNTFDINGKINIINIIETSPTIAIKPKIFKLNYYNVSITINLWKKGKIFAIILQKNDTFGQALPLSS
jgi:hypothetical protein